MGNVLTEEKKQQILALGRLGWSLRRIQQATRVRRETISGYLKAAGITVWRLGGWSRQGRPKPAMQVITGSMPELPVLNPNITYLGPFVYVNSAQSEKMAHVGAFVCGSNC